MKRKGWLWAVVLVGLCSTAAARPRRAGVGHISRHTVSVVTRPADYFRVPQLVLQPVVQQITQLQITQRQRLAMAVAYLNSNEYLSTKKYAQITGLSKPTAEAELELFACDGQSRLLRIAVGKKLYYTLK